MLAHTLAMAVLGLGVMGHQAAHADDREQEQVRRLKAQIRQVQQQQETATQEAEAKANAADAAKAEMGKSLKSAQSDAAAQRAAAGVASRKVKALNDELDAVKKDKVRLDTELAQARKALEDFKAQTAAQQDQSTQTIAGWQGRYKQLSDAQDQCRAHNAALYTLGMDLLSKYENKGMGNVMATNEPFLMIARVKLENIKADYQDKLDAARLSPTAAGRP